MKNRHLWLSLLLVLAMAVSGCIDDDDDDDNDDGGGGGGNNGSSHTLTVENDSSHNVFYLYVSPTTSDTWGSDVLGSSIIEAGTTFTHSVSDCDRSYDLRAETSDGAHWEWWDVSMSCGMESTWTLTD